MLIAVQYGNYDIKQVFIDLGSSTNILLWDVFQKLYLEPNNIKVFQGYLIGFSDEQVQVRDHVTL